MVIVSYYLTGGVWLLFHYYLTSLRYSLFNLPALNLLPNEKIGRYFFACVGSNEARLDESNNDYTGIQLSTHHDTSLNMNLLIYSG